MSDALKSSKKATTKMQNKKRKTASGKPFWLPEKVVDMTRKVRMRK